MKSIQYNYRLFNPQRIVETGIVVGDSVSDCVRHLLQSYGAESQIISLENEPLIEYRVVLKKV